MEDMSFGHMQRSQGLVRDPGKCVLGLGNPSRANRKAEGCRNVKRPSIIRSFPFPPTTELAARSLAEASTGSFHAGQAFCG
jgi:hypothetical protein